MSTGQKGPQGLRLNGVKYVVTRTVPDPLTIYAKVRQAASQSVSQASFVLRPPAAAAAAADQGGLLLVLLVGGGGGAQGGGGGCCLTKTGHTILAATWLQEKGHTGPGCNMAVEKLGEYLREKQF